MDSLIHYRPADICRIMAGLAARTDEALLVTFAPKTPALAVMHAVGRLFPRGDRAPAIEPVAEQKLRRLADVGRGPRALAARPQPPGRERLLQIAGIGDDSPMTRISTTLAKGWMRLGTRFLPFADAATKELPLGRLLRLSLFQVSTGISIVLLNGTLNRVMIVELGVSTLLVSLMVSLPLVFAPFRVLIGFKSDNHRSVLGWRRVPYIWMGTLVQFGGFAILPFALLVLSGTGEYPAVYGQFGAALAFLLVGAGMHTAQTAGLALATDLAPAEVAAAGRRVPLRDAAVRHGRQRADLQRAAAQFQRDPADPGDPGRRGHAVAAQHLRALEAGSAQPVADVGRRASGPNFSTPGPSSASPAARSASWSRWRSAPRPSRCRTSCWSPTAPRSSS